MDPIFKRIKKAKDTSSTIAISLLGIFPTDIPTHVHRDSRWDPVALITTASKVMVLPVVMYGCESSSRGLSTKESMLLNCGAGDDS